MNGSPAYPQLEVKDYGLLKKLFHRGKLCTDAEPGDCEKDKAVLLKNITQAQQDWMNAVTNFDQAEDAELIDYYIYKMKACQVRYNYLLKKAKEIGLKQDIHCS